MLRPGIRSSTAASRTGRVRPAGLHLGARLHENEWVKGEWQGEPVQAMLATEWASLP
jgi:hypothetical protein